MNPLLVCASLSLAAIIFFIASTVLLIQELLRPYDGPEPTVDVVKEDRRWARGGER